MSASTTETYEFAVSGTPRLVVRNRAGDIRFQAGADGQVRIVVTKRAHDGPSGRVSQADLEQIAVRVSQNGGAIRVETENERGISLGASYTVEIAVTSPASAELDLRMNAGNIEVRGISGTIEGTVNAGNLDVAGGTLAGRCSCTVNAGNLNLETAIAQGASLDADVNAGKMRLLLPRDTPAYLDARADVGSIDVDGWPVNSSRQLVRQVVTGRLGAEPVGTVRLRVNSGSITARAI